jgi:hypothetical protein
MGGTISPIASLSLAASLRMARADTWKDQVQEKYFKNLLQNSILCAFVLKPNPELGFILQETNKK